MGRLTKKAVTESIDFYDGNVSAVARSFKVSRQAIYEFCKVKYPALWDRVVEKRAEWLDDAESELKRQMMEDHNTTALIFFLKTQGKGRGYVERQELAGVDDQPVKISLVEVIKTEDSDAGAAD
jgi:predicted DNA-binding protein YlxM (UPF0122 family)